MTVVEKHFGERCVCVAGAARTTGQQLAGYSGDFIQQPEKNQWSKTWLLGVRVIASHHPQGMSLEQSSGTSALPLPQLGQET